MSHVIFLPKHLGEALVARRKVLKLSQKNVATRLGISQNRLSELEADPSRIPLERLIAWLQLLGLELAVSDKTPAPSGTEW